MTYKVPVYDGGQFSWSRDSDGNSTGVTEASTLHISPPRVLLGVRVWEGACDGFLIRSPKTGRELLFVFAQEMTDYENEPMAWRFICHDEPSVSVVIAND